MKYHTLLTIEPFQLWLQIYIFNRDENDGGVFYDESFIDVSRDFVAEVPSY